MSNGETATDRQSDYEIAVENTERLRLATETALARGDAGSANLLAGLLRVGYADVLDFLEAGAANLIQGGLNDE